MARKATSKPGKVSSRTGEADELSENAKEQEGNSQLKKRWLPRVLLALLFGLLCLNLFEFPHHAYDTTHDLSSHATFEYYTAKKFQYGTEVFQNVGPYGFVHYAYSYCGFLHVEKTILRNLTRAVLVLLILWASARMEFRWQKILWITSFFVFVPFGDSSNNDYLDLDEVYAYLSVYLAGLFLFEQREHAIGTIMAIPVILYLSFLSLTKHTSMVLSISAISMAAFNALLSRKWQETILIPGLYILFGTIFWTIAGQKIGNLPDFILGVFKFSGGYNEAMASQEPANITFLGVLSLAPFFAAIGVHSVLQPAAIGRRVMEAFFLFVIWKHSFVRADTHHNTLLFYTLFFFAGTVYFLHLKHSVKWQPSFVSKLKGRIFNPLLLNGVAYGFALIGSCIALNKSIPGCSWRPLRLMNHFKHNLSWMVSPAGRTREMQKLVEEQKNIAALPQVRERVGSATIDYFGFNPGYLLLNDLNYKPRPMPITFAAANEFLLRKNEDFYRDPQRSPEFLLMEYMTIDGRFLPLDDGLALGAVFDNYEPLMVEKGLLLLKRKAAETLRQSQEFQLLQEVKVKFGEGFEIPKTVDSNCIWMEVKFTPSVYGKLKGFLYKPAPCFVDYTFRAQGNSYEVRNKFITSMASVPFLVAPLVLHHDDVIQTYLNGSAFSQLSRIQNMSFQIEPADRKYFEPDISVKFYSTPEIPAISAQQS